MNLNKLFKNHYFLLLLQFFTLLIFILIIYGGIGITSDDKNFAKILRNTNLSNLIVWSYWWALIIVTAIIFGRFWCSICPMELLTSLAGKYGFRRKPGTILKSGWIITLFYAIILVVGIHTFAIHRIPQLMAVYMLVLFAVAVIAGFIWEKRTFCTYICPIGHLLGMYSLLSIKKLRVIDPNVCKDCNTKDCISKENHYKYIGHSCTSELYPAKISDNRKCILCGQCHKSCTKDNIAIKKQRFDAKIFSNINLSWAEIAFFMLVSGFVVYEVLSEWSVTKIFLMTLPHYLNEILGVTGKLTGTIKAITLFILVPFLFYSFFAFIIKMNGSETWKKSFTQLAIAILPITASMHLLKAILKMSSRIPYWDFVFSDPKGVETARAIIANPEVLDKSILLSLFPYISVIAILLLLTGILFSYFIIRKQDHLNIISKLLTYCASFIYASLFLITIVFWRFL